MIVEICTASKDERDAVIEQLKEEKGLSWQYWETGIAITEYHIKFNYNKKLL